MKKKNILLGIILLSIMVFSKTGWAAEEDFLFDNMDYLVTGYQGAGGDLTIPEYIQECPVEGIDNSVFYSNQDITGLKLPETLLSIGSSCFYYNENLSSVTLPDSLVAIGNYNFWSCPQLTEVVIPGKVSFIGNNSFSFCDNLNSITFKGVVPHIEPYCFDGIAENAVFYVPEDQIDAYAEVLPAGANIFSSGNMAEVYDFTETEEAFEFDSETGTITNYLAFGTRIDIPENIDGVPVLAIGASAFEGNSYAYYISIPEGVTEIGDYAFAGMENLSYVDFPSTLKNIGNSAFASYRGSDLDLPEGLEIIGDEAFAGASLDSGIVLPEGMKHVGKEAFRWVYATDVYFPESIESVDEKAFYSSNVSYVCFEGKELPEIAGNAFEEAYLTDVDINWQASKTQMNTAQAFFDDLGMEARVWRMQNPNVELATIESGGCYEDNKITGYTGTATNISPYTILDDIMITAVGDGAFQGNQQIKYFAVDHGDEFTTIGAEAFADSSLEYIDLFDSVTTIGSGAFRNCVNMTELILPESITEIGEGAFEGCTGLETLTLLCDASVIPEGCFASCSALENVYVAETAADDQVAAAQIAANLPWYKKAFRLGEENTNVFYEMPYKETNVEDFWYDESFRRLDTYQGYEVNMYLPREIDGIPMDMVGSGVLARAQTYEEGTDPELPVRSVVIPETVKEIPGYTFSDCPTLETIICYAPIDFINGETFLNCPNLREVVFVNGVREIGALAFSGCPALKTVYIGEFLKSIDSTAFTNTGISAEDCIQSADAMPDIEELLTAVKSDPITPPEPEIKETIEFAPMDAEIIEPYLGFWSADQILFGDTVYTAEEFGMESKFELREDGSAVLIEGTDSVTTQWGIQDETAVILYDGDIYLRVKPGEDGTLVYTENEDGMIMEMYFVRGEAGE